MGGYRALCHLHIGILGSLLFASLNASSTSMTLPHVALVPTCTASNSSSLPLEKGVGLRRLCPRLTLFPLLGSIFVDGVTSSISFMFSHHENFVFLRLCRLGSTVYIHLVLPPLSSECFSSICSTFPVVASPPVLGACGRSSSSSFNDSLTFHPLLNWSPGGSLAGSNFLVP